MARQPVVFNEVVIDGYLVYRCFIIVSLQIGAHLLFSAEGGIEPFEPALVLIGCGGFEL